MSKIDIPNKCILILKKIIEIFIIRIKTLFRYFAETLNFWAKVTKFREHFYEFLTFGKFGTP